MMINLMVACEYWEDDSSRYRLAITNETLIPSLVYENLTDAHIWLRQCPMDPRWSIRREAFRYLSRPAQHRGMHPTWKQVKERRPVIEITTPDDVAFVPGFLGGLRRLAERTTENTTIWLTGGLLWEDRKYFECRGVGPVVRILVEDTPQLRTVREFRRVAWCVPRHQMNDAWVDGLEVGRLHASSLPCLSDSRLGRYCRTRILTGTAAGATALYHRGGSWIRSNGWKGRRSP